MTDSSVVSPISRTSVGVEGARRAGRSDRITVDNFLADGGDGFKIFRQARDPLPGIFDVDALEDYMKTVGTIEATASGRITEVE